MTIPSTSDAENYGWMKDMPASANGSVPASTTTFESTNAQLKNKDWEHTIAKRTAIEDDKLAGIFTNLFQIQASRRAIRTIQVGLAAAGFTLTGFDGQYFDTDHRTFGRDKKEKDWSNVQAGGGAPLVPAPSRSFMKPWIPPGPQ